MTATPTRNPFVPTAEAAFIAGIPDRQMHRVIDEKILPESLMSSENGRLFARLGAALASFYFEEESVLVADARRLVIAELVDRLSKRKDWELLLTLPRKLPSTIDWRVSLTHIYCNILPFIEAAGVRANEIENAETLVTSDPEILSGTPVFKGTRVPIDMVLASVVKGIDISRIRAAYPFVTGEHVTAARTYIAVHPKRGRPSRPTETDPSLKPSSRGVIRHQKQARA